MRRRVRLEPHEKDQPSHLNITTAMRPSNPRHAAPRALSLLHAVALLVSLAPTTALAQAPDPDEPALPEPPPTAQELAEAERARELTEQELAELAAATDRPLHTKLSWRVGPVLNALYGSNQGRPFIYPYVGARYKVDDLYVDVHAPAVLGMLDGLAFLFQDQIADVPREQNVNLFELANDLRHYAFFQIIDLRLGQTFTIDPWATETTTGFPLQLSVGAEGFFDFVLFDLPGFTGDLDDFDFNATVQRDPVVGAVGLFGAVGAHVGPFSGDLALVFARDLFDWDAYAPASGWIIALDSDLQIEITPNIGMYVRPRWSFYTHVEGSLIQTLVLTAGVVFSG